MRGGRGMKVVCVRHDDGRGGRGEGSKGMGDRWGASGVGRLRGMRGWCVWGVDVRGGHGGGVNIGWGKGGAMRGIREVGGMGVVNDW